MSNTLKGGNKSHSVETLSGMFRVLPQKVKDARCDKEIAEPAASADNFGGVTVVSQNSILGQSHACQGTSGVQIQLH